MICNALHNTNDAHNHNFCDHGLYNMNDADSHNKDYSDDDKLQRGRDDGNTLVSDIYYSHIHDVHIRNHRS